MKLKNMLDIVMEKWQGHTHISGSKVFFFIPSEVVAEGSPEGVSSSRSALPGSGASGSIMSRTRR